jgi:hypothetical protein
MRMEDFSEVLHFLFNCLDIYPYLIIIESGIHNLSITNRGMS